MSRSSYTDDFGEEFPGQLELFRANVERAIKSRKGQARLRELLEALDAMPEKRLYANVFIDGAKMCALGAWAAQRPTVLEAVKPIIPPPPDDDDDEDDGVCDDTLVDYLHPFDWPPYVVRELVYQNDDHAYYLDTMLDVEKAAEARWTHVRRWVADHLSGATSTR